MNQTPRSPADDLKYKANRDILIIILSVIVVSVVVVLTILCGGIAGIIALAVATVAIGGCKEVTAVIAIRYDEAAKSAILAGDATLSKDYERKSSKISEWSSAAALFTWVLGVGAVLTGVLELVEKSG